MNRVLVTGANGFVGRMLCDALAQSGYIVRGAVREASQLPPSVTEIVVVGDIARNPSWQDAVTDVQYVIHTAALAHVASTRHARSLYLQTNGDATLQLAMASARAGVRRFVYLSSIKVNGEETADRRYSANDEPQPEDIYAESKRLGERYVFESCERTGMEAVIARSPLVYGPEVRANFLRLLQWIDRGRPLPFGAVRNSRSLVNVWNLCDLLVRTLIHPAAPGRVWMASDAEDLSTPDLIRRIANAMERPVNLISVPPVLMRAVGALTGRTAEIRRVCGSLTVDVDSTCKELAWSPPVSVDEGLIRTAHWYLSSR